MTVKQLAKSNNKFYSDVVLIILVALFSAVGCYYLFSFAVEKPNLQLEWIFFGGVVGLFGLWILSKLFEFDTIEIYSGEVRIISIFGHTKKVIKRQEIVKWYEIEKSNQSMKWKVLTVLTDKEHFKVNSSFYHNYQEIKILLIENSQEDSTKQNKYQRKHELILSSFFFLLAFFLVFLTFSSIYSLNKEIHQSELETLKEMIVLDASIGKGKGRSLNLKLKDFSEFEFTISGINFNAAKPEKFISEFKKGDTLDIDILREDYLTRFTKQKEPSFLDKSVNYYFVTFYGLRDKNNNYLTLKEINFESKKDKKIGIIIFPLLALGSLLFGAYFLLKSKKTSLKSQNND